MQNIFSEAMVSTRQESCLIRRPGCCNLINKPDACEEDPPATLYPGWFGCLRASQQSEGLLTPASYHQLCAVIGWQTVTLQPKLSQNPGCRLKRSDGFRQTGRPCELESLASSERAQTAPPNNLCHPEE